MLYVNDVSKREVGNLPLSIGTSFAIEALSLKDAEGNEIKEPLPKAIWINLRTLFRNLHNGVDTELRKRISEADMIPVLLEEVKFILQFVPEVTRGVTRVQLYVCTYDDLKNLYPHAVLKEVKTPLQKSYVLTEQAFIDYFLKNYKETFDVKVFRTELDGAYEDAWLLTHSPVDLLSYKRFGKIALVESHTGRVKLRSSWNTKLTGGKDHPNIPFNAFTLQVFGDNVYFGMMPRVVKESVLEMARDYNWTAVTTMEKIRFSIAGMRDHFGREFLRKLAK